MSNEYRVQITIKNNLLASAIEEAGYSSVLKFCEEKGLAYGTVLGFLAMKIAPLTREGEFMKQARMLMEVQGAAPHDLWTEDQLTLRLPDNRAFTSVGKAEIEALMLWRQQATTNLEDACDSRLLRKVIANAFDASKLSPKERKVLKLRFEHELSLEDTAQAFDVTRERIRQIESKAIRKLKQPEVLEIFAAAGVEK